MQHICSRLKWLKHEIISNFATIFSKFVCYRGVRKRPYVGKCQMRFLLYIQLTKEIVVLESCYNKVKGKCTRVAREFGFHPIYYTARTPPEVLFSNLRLWLHSSKQFRCNGCLIFIMCAAIVVYFEGSGRSI